MRLCASPHVQRSFAQTPSPGVLLPLPLPCDARASPELPGRLGPGSPRPTQSSPDCLPATVLAPAQGRPHLPTAGVQSGYTRVESRPVQTSSHGQGPRPHGRKTLGDCSGLQPHCGTARAAGRENVQGQGQGLGWAASRFLRHLRELTASLLAGVIWPNPLTVPVCPAGLGPAASPFGS